MAQYSTVFIQCAEKSPPKVILVGDFSRGYLWTYRPFVNVGIHIQAINSSNQFTN